jgi:serine/threonine-protein kinase
VISELVLSRKTIQVIFSIVTALSFMTMNSLVASPVSATLLASETSTTTAITPSQTTPSQNTTTTSDNFLAYENPTYGIKIQYPVDWTASQNGLQDYTDIIAFYSPLENISDRFPEQLSISVIDYSQNITLNDYTNRITDTLKQSPNLEIIQSNATTLAGNPAHKIVFSPMTGEQQQQFKPEIMQIWTIKGDKAYSILYVAESVKYSNYLSTVQKMVNSFEITK